MFLYEDIEHKNVKIIHPRTNNGKILEFVFDRDPNLFLRKNKIVIRGAFEVHENYIIENGFAHKLFSMATVELDSQVITKNLNK